MASGDGPHLGAMDDCGVGSAYGLGRSLVDELRGGDVDLHDRSQQDGLAGFGKDAMDALHVLGSSVHFLDGQRQAQVREEC